MCASLPVVFPLLGGIANYIYTSMLSYKRYLSGIATSTKDSDAGADGETVMSKLPQLPSGKLDTLISFIRGRGLSQNEVSQGRVSVTKTTDIEMAPYSELRSVDVDYHAYLSGPPPRAYHTANAQKAEGSAASTQSLAR